MHIIKFFSIGGLQSKLYKIVKPDILDTWQNVWTHTGITQMLCYEICEVTPFLKYYHTYVHLHTSGAWMDFVNSLADWLSSLLWLELRMYGCWGWLVGWLIDWRLQNVLVLMCLLNNPTKAIWSSACWTSLFELNWWVHADVRFLLTLWPIKREMHMQRRGWICVCTVLLCRLIDSCTYMYINSNLESDQWEMRAITLPL